MKKLISVLVCIVLVLSMMVVFSACSKGDSSDDSFVSGSDIEYVQPESTSGDIVYTEPVASDSDIN